MTTHRRLLILLLVAWAGMLPACGGGGKKSETAQPQVEIKEVKAANPTASEDAPHEAIIKEATKSQDEAIARREQVRARNDARKRQYEEDLASFKKAYTQYKSLRELDFAKNLKTQAGLAKWYSDIVREFPGTEVSTEAQRRLVGGPPKSLPVPPMPIAPKQPEYEPDLYWFSENRSLAFETLASVQGL